MLQLTKAQLLHYEEHGFLILPKLLPEDRRSPMLDECMDAWKREDRKHDRSASWLHNALLSNVHHQCETVRRYYFSGPLVEAAQQLIGPNIKGATSQLSFKLRGNGQSVGWHQDNGYGELEPANAVSALTAFDDTDRENGCLWLIPASHRLGQIDVSDHYTSEQKARGDAIDLQVDNERVAMAIPMRAGDVILFHCHLLHRSEGNQSDRDRRILFLRYADADAVEVYNENQPRLGPLMKGTSCFESVQQFESELVADTPAF